MEERGEVLANGLQVRHFFDAQRETLFNMEVRMAVRNPSAMAIPLSIVGILFIVFFIGCTQSNQPSGGAVISAVSDAELQVYGLFPNPFQDSTVLSYEILKSDAESVRCVIYNSAGERIQSYSLPSDDSSSKVAFRSKNSAYKQGMSFCVWDGSSDFGPAPNGVYYIELELRYSDHELTQRHLCMRRR